MISYKDAKQLLDEGFSVFPVNISWDEEEKKYQKKPAVAWKEYQDRLPTDEELHNWFDKEIYNGIGIATGKTSGVVVVDVEVEDLDNVIREFGLESGLVSNTISGGKHFFYKWPGVKIPNTVKVNGKKVDFRGDGGFVVAPPSGTGDHVYTWGSDNEPSLLPGKFTEKKWVEVNEGLKLSEYTSVGKGSRNNDLYKVACSLISKHGADEAWNLVVNVNNTYDPPLPVREVKTLFSSAYKFIGESKKEKRDMENESFLIGEPQQWSSIREEENKKEWIWENYIAKGNVTLLSALWKAGKTTFLRCFFLALNQEEEFAGQPTKKSKVLVISEEAMGEWSDNREDLSDKDISHVLVWSRPIRGKPNLKQWSKMIEEITERCKRDSIDMVVIDTLTTFWPIDNENDSAQVIKALVPLYSFTENNIAVVLVHHFRKGGGDQAQASRGSGALPGFVDNIIEFTRSGDGYPNQRTLKTYGRFDGVIPEIVIELDGSGKYVTKGEPWQVSKKARLEKLLKIFEESPIPLSAKDAYNIWSSTVIGSNLRTVQRYIRELSQENLLATTENRTVAGKNVPYYARSAWKEVTHDNGDTVPLRVVVSQVDQKTVAGAVVASPKSVPTATTRQPSMLKEDNFVAGKGNNKSIGYKDDDITWID